MANRSPSKTSKRVISAAERRIRSIDLRRDGKSYRDIARANGTSVSCAFKDVSDGLLKLAQKETDAARGLRQLQSERLTVAVGAIMPKVKKGDMEAIHALARLVELESKLYGLLQNAPMVEVSNTTITLAWQNTPLVPSDIPDGEKITIEPTPLELTATIPTPPLVEEMQRLNARYG